ncbi:MAG: hypothetical protein CL920_38645 [Deltaproteobacteria bacterium]|nr:hypothetical protein [Deltaproteobacteria bacterium]MBU54652.1 hypothetical protein [Deltaproteobacteria bacterium]|tara:strand:- start:220 stop:3456 length:3237 start_codon:yes stop_codon:yes gene_type:complete
MGRSFEDRAKQAVEDGSWETLTWKNVANTKFVGIIYTEAAEKDDTLASELERFRHVRSGKPNTWMYLLDAPQKRLAPYIVSMLHDDWWHNHLPEVMRAGLDIGEPISSRLQSSKDEVKDMIFPLLSGSPHKEDRDAAFSYLEKAPDKPDSYRWSSKKQDKFLISLGFARQNDERADAILNQVLEELTDPSYVPQEKDGLEELLIALKQRVDSPLAKTWGAMLTNLLHRGVAIFKCTRAFAEAGCMDDSLDKVRALYTMWIDNAAQTRFRRVGLSLILASPENPPELEDARWLRDYLHVQRYGWPKSEQLAEVHELCGELFLDYGTESEKQWVATFATSSERLLHDLGDRARAALGLEPVQRIFVDEPTVSALEDEDIFALMQNEYTIWDSSAHYKAMGFLKSAAEEDKEWFERLVKWARKKIEDQPNFPISYYETTPPDTRYALGFLKRDLSEEQKEQYLSDSQSAWIRQECFEEKVTHPTPPPPVRPESIKVKPMADDAFALGAAANAMAVSPQGDMLCVVGGGGGQIFSLPDGAPLTRLQTGGHAYDCTFTPDNQHVIACFHGGHIWMFDTKTGQDVKKFKGHSGVPHGVRRLTLNEDASRMASGDDNGTLILWDLATGKPLWEQEIKGVFTDILFLQDGRVIASYIHETKRGTKKSAILLVDENGENAKSSKRAFPIWTMAIRQDGMLAMGGEEGEILVGTWKKTRFKAEHTLDVQNVVSLRWSGQQLQACTKEGKLVHVDFHANGPVVQDVETQANSTDMVACGETSYLASGSTIQIVDGMTPRPKPAIHVDRVTAVLELSDGTLLSLDSRSNILRWLPGESKPTQLASLGLYSAYSLVPIDDDFFVCVGSKGLYTLSTKTGDIVASVEGEGIERACTFDDHGALVNKEGISFFKLPSLEPVDTPVINVGRGKSIANSPNGLQLLVGTDGGHLGCWEAGEWVWQRADHGTDTFEVGNPHRSICSVAFSPDGAFAVSGATDDVIRVYDAKDGTPLLRFQCGFGLFNRLSISPDSRWLAVPDGGKLYIIDLQKNALYATLPTSDFGGKTIITAHFLQDGSLIVSNGTHSLYRVSMG